MQYGESIYPIPRCLRPGNAVATSVNGRHVKRPKTLYLSISRIILTTVLPLELRAAAKRLGVRTIIFALSDDRTSIICCPLCRS